MGEDRPPLKLKFAPAIGILDDEVRAEDVRRHQVRRELDAVERQFEHFAERADEQRFAEARHALEQHVSAGKDGDERAFHNRVVADDDLADFGAQRGVGLTKRLDLFFGCHSVVEG